MIKINRQTFVLFLVFFIVQTAVNLGNYTSLIYSAVSFLQLSKPAFVVLFQTLGNLLAFLLLNNSRLLLVKRISLPKLILVNAFLALFSSNLSNFLLWVFFVMCRIAASTILVSRLQALLSVTTKNKEDTQYFSKHMQFLHMVSFLISLTASPLVQQYIGVSNVYLIDMICMLVVCGIVSITAIGMGSASSSAQTDTKGIKILPKEILIFVPYVLWLWTVAGSFHIIEIPYLAKILNFSSLQITIVFLLAGTGAILGSIFVPLKFVTAYKKPTAVWAAVIISALSLLYLKTATLPVILAIVFLYGITNGFFNVAAANMIYDKIPADKQTTAFAVYRVVTNLSIVLAAVVMSAFGDVSNAFKGQVVLTFVGIAMYFILCTIDSMLGKAYV